MKVNFSTNAWNFPDSFQNPVRIPEVFVPYMKAFFSLFFLNKDVRIVLGKGWLWVIWQWSGTVMWWSKWLIFCIDSLFKTVLFPNVIGSILSYESLVVFFPVSGSALPFPSSAQQNKTEINALPTEQSPPPAIPRLAFPALHLEEKWATLEGGGSL